LRHVMINGEPWFVVADLAAMLGYRDGATAARNLRNGQKGPHSVRTPGGMQETLVCNEGGIWRLIMRSNRPEAEAIQDWITDKVLPATRKTVFYPAAPTKFETPKTYAEALGAAADATERADAGKARVKEIDPAATAWDRLAAEGSDYSVRAAAQV